jgi:hypothetical protein
VTSRDQPCSRYCQNDLTSPFAVTAYNRILRSLGASCPAIWGLTIPLTYLVGRQLFDKHVELVGALILAVYHLGYSTLKSDACTTWWFCSVSSRVLFLAIFEGAQQQGLSKVHPLYDAPALHLRLWLVRVIAQNI